MATSFLDTKRHLDELAVNFLWHQWSSIGVAGGVRSNDGWMIDPEALVLATSRFGRHDPRLMDESIDWLVRYGRRINVLRLQSLHEQWPGIADGRVLAAIGSIVGKQSALRKWRGIGQPARSDAEREPLFISSTGGYLPVFGDPDSDFKAAGLLRSPVEHRGMSNLPNTRARGNLIFLLRAFFGVNARAEIFAWLLVHGSGNPAAIARDTGYFIKSVQLTLNEMEESCQILSSRQGREKIYRVIGDAWHFLLLPHGSQKDQRVFPAWFDWMPVFAIITRMAETFSIPDLDVMSEHFQAIKIRDALDTLKPAIDRIAVTHGWRTTTDLRGADLIQSLLVEIDSLLG